MDNNNYLSLLGRGLTLQDKIYFFPLSRGGFKPELSNYLIV